MKKIALILTAFLLMFGLAFAVVENLEVPPKQYTGNGVTTDFPITFDYTDDSDLTVSFVNDSDGSIDAWTQDALGDQGYTIVNDEVIANTAPDDGRLVIDGETPLTQTLNLKNNRATPAELYESALDKGILATRDVKAILDRTMTAPATADPDVDYTAPAYEAGSYWQWHPTLKELRNAAISGSTTTIGTDVGDIVELIDDGSGNGVFPEDQLRIGTDVGDVVKLIDDGSGNGVFPQETVQNPVIYSAGIDYNIYSRVFGSDGIEYRAFIANGPDSTVVNPVGDVTGTWIDVFTLSPQRSMFEFKDVDEVYLNGAVYLHDGTKKQLVYWDTKLTYQFQNLAVSDWSYLYLDDSAIVTADTQGITASELIDSTTEPVWSDAKKGWYNGEDRCFFAALTNGSSEVLEFLHADDLVLFGVDIEDLAPTDIDTTWTDVTLTLPSFTKKAEVYFSSNSTADTAGSFLSWRTNGQASNGHIVCFTDADDIKQSVNTVSVITSSVQIIEIKHDVSGLHKATVRTNGWYFPIGM